MCFPSWDALASLLCKKIRACRHKCARVPGGIHMFASCQHVSASAHQRVHQQWCKWGSAGAFYASQEVGGLPIPIRLYCSGPGNKAPIRFRSPYSRRLTKSFDFRHCTHRETSNCLQLPIEGSYLSTWGSKLNFRQGGRGGCQLKRQGAPTNDSDDPADCIM